MVKEVWIGLIHIRPNIGNEILHEIAGGAFVSVFILASSKFEYIDKVKAWTKELNLVFVEAEEVMTFNDRLHSNIGVSDEFIEMAKYVENTGKMRISKFDQYLKAE